MEKYDDCRMLGSTHVRSGATLVELLVGMSVCVLAIGCSITHIDFMHKMSVRSVVDELHTTCSYLRMASWVSGIEHTLTFLPEQGCYTWQEHKVALPPSVIYGVVDGAQGPPSSPQNPIEKSVTFPAYSVRFTPSGNIQAGSVYLVDRARRYGYALTSSISSYSYLRRYEYDGSWQLVL